MKVSKGLGAGVAAGRQGMASNRHWDEQNWKRSSYTQIPILLSLVKKAKRKMAFLFPKKWGCHKLYSRLWNGLIGLKMPYSQNIATYDLRPLFKNLTKISFSHSYWYMYKYINIYKKL